MASVYPTYRKQYLPGTVFDAALNRIRWLFEEFDNQVSVSTSGGKDSTVVAELALIVARERGALPLKVHWLDQEAEYESTVRYQRDLLNREEVRGHWYQIPFRLQNAVNHDDPWLDCWRESGDWVRPKELNSIHVNEFGVRGFIEVLTAIGNYEGGAVLTGLRTEESPSRRLGLTSYPAYKWVTWSNKEAKNHQVFHPIYDWGFRDVWKAIHDNGWAYNQAYDYQFQYGVPSRDMRVSSLTHDSAIKSLFWLQEFEPATYEALTRRLPGVSTAARLGREDYYVHSLPYMFEDWTEYHDYLVEHIVTSPEDRATFHKQREALLRTLPHLSPDKISRECVRHVLSNDVWFVKGNQFYLVHHQDAMRWKKQHAQA